MKRISILCPAILIILFCGIGTTADHHNPIEVRFTQPVSNKVLKPTGVPKAVEVRRTQLVIIPDFNSTDMPRQVEYRILLPVIVNESDQTPGITPINSVLEMIGHIDQDRVVTDLNRLTGIEPTCTDSGCHTITNRETGSQELQWAKDYVHEELASLGYTVEMQDWSREGYSDQNLIVRKPGLAYPNSEIYLVAHMDGVNPEGSDTSPAADDDASGVVDMLEMARILSNHSFSRTVVLLFSTGEEQGTLGVISYLAQLSSNELSKIAYVIDVDMVSYDSNSDGAMQLWSGDHPPSQVFAQLLNDIIHAYQLNLEPSIVAGCT